MRDPELGVIGATSLVGRCLILQAKTVGRMVRAYSRHPQQPESGVEWRLLSGTEQGEPLPEWICVAPIWVLPDYFPFLEACGVRRIVVLSSTSRFSKMGSKDANENFVAGKLIEGEERLAAWAKERAVEWVILRPTLIYGLGLDKNIVEIARFIDRFGFFPVFGAASGLRQPIHAEDVAAACLAALRTPKVLNCAYNISGGESLSYREMVMRVFFAMGRPCRLLRVPLAIFRLALIVLRRLPRFRQWSPAMAERMNISLVFEHQEAKRDFCFEPRAFALSADDLPKNRSQF